jgi:plasmid stabilization system protein ParE
LNARYRVAPAALDDIDEIADWIWSNDPGSDADLRFIEAIYDAFALLASQPGIGHKRGDLTDLPVLFWTVMKSFAVIYRVGKPLEVVRVIRWTRNIPAILGEG